MRLSGASCWLGWRRMWCWSLVEVEVEVMRVCRRRSCGRRGGAVYCTTQGEGQCGVIGEYERHGVGSIIDFRVTPDSGLVVLSSYCSFYSFPRSLIHVELFIGFFTSPIFFNDRP
ncbi:hypothetical protein DM02DRAFT_356932 [Periconia macrospinosa]|uniref:Secreted protein n=1 Tax=Periconia macrospinosa TaxID=97972 RepID=A0A2V1E9K4_9PLEO|nr:hypothetical protein DM02DRAFT_356932 [Periconia macrospinosa]